MKKTLSVGVIVVAAVMTGVIGFRLSSDAISIIVGAVLGMMAILPTVAVVAYLLKKNQESLTPSQPHSYSQPPVVVVSGGMMPQYQHPQMQQPMQNPQAMLPPPTQNLPRKFHLMGYEDTDRLEVSDEEWVSAG